jgi:hypothetical protein
LGIPNTQNAYYCGRSRKAEDTLRGDIQMQDEYIVPELKLVGNASEVVQGGIGVGADIMSMWIAGVLEFQED